MQPNFHTPPSTSALFYLGRFCLIALFLAGLSSSLQAQAGRTPTETLAIKLEQHAYRSHPQKLYLETDRNQYFQGDTLWFSAWLTNARTHLPDSLERILYLEVQDKAGQLLSKQLFELNQGRAMGQIALPFLDYSVEIRLVAYTNFMRNAGPDYYFNKELLLLALNDSEQDYDNNEKQQQSVYTVSEEKSSFGRKKTAPQEEALLLTFMPEGGEMVAGIPARVAFIATANAGSPARIQGKVVDQTGTTLAFIHSDAKGRGVFSLTPEAGQSYAVLITDEQGIEATYPLPKVLEDGFALMADNRWNSFLINVSVYGLEKAEAPLLLTVTQRGRLEQAYEIPHGKANALVQVDKSSLQTGIAQLTLFDAELNPRLERLVFINKGDQMAQSNAVFTEADQGEIKILVQDGQARPIAGGFALSLTPLSQTDSLLVQYYEMEQYFYLHSELPGLEKNCPYFFRKDFAAHREADLVMMTNGWRRFKWDDVMADTLVMPGYMLETGFYLSGLVQNLTRREEPATGIGVTLMGSGSVVFAGSTTTDEKGHFVFDLENFNDTIDVLVQTRTEKDKTRDYDLLVETNLGRMVYGHLVSPPLVSVSPENTMGTSTADHEAFVSVLSAAKVERTRLRALYQIADSADILLDEVKISARKRLSPLEKMYALYGKEDYAIGEDSISQVNREERWNYGLFGVLEHLIPEISTIPGRWGSLRPEQYPIFPRLPNNIMELGARLNLDDIHTIRYDDAPRTRIYFHVDGQLAGFTNHVGHIDWALSGLYTLDLKNIKSVGVIRNPKLSPLGEAMSVRKRPEECYCPDFLLPYFLNNSPEAFLQADDIIVSIHTINQIGLGKGERNSGLFKTKLSGYTASREFYAPPVVESGPEKYYAPTLFWHPDLKPNPAGEITIVLDKNLLPEHYKISITGLSQEGIPFSRTMSSKAFESNERK